MFSCPGRVNIIGEHTDYHHGYVFPAPVSQAIYFAIYPNTVNKYRFYAYNLEETFETSTDKVEKCKTGWANYLLGSIFQFKKDKKFIQGFDLVFGGNIPKGAGMSSSSAIVVGTMWALNKIYNLKYTNL